MYVIVYSISSIFKYVYTVTYADYIPKGHGQFELKNF